jgi:hypothetical protein
MIRLLPCCLVAFGFIFAAGCQQSGDTGEQETAEHKARSMMTEDQKRQKMQEDIRNNPHMPQAAKDAAAGALGAKHGQ